MPHRPHQATLGSPRLGRLGAPIPVSPRPDTFSGFLCEIDSRGGAGGAGSRDRARIQARSQLIGVTSSAGRAGRTAPRRLLAPPGSAAHASRAPCPAVPLRPSAAESCSSCSVAAGGLPASGPPRAPFVDAPLPRRGVPRGLAVRGAIVEIWAGGAGRGCSLTLRARLARLARRAAFRRFTAP